MLIEIVNQVQPVINFATAAIALSLGGFVVAVVLE
jgi:hypothetical protein